MDKLLLIDDETDMHYSFRRIFSDSGVEVATASSGEEGLRAVPEIEPDVVILDVRMGGISGLETLRRLRQTDPRLPVIIMTAYGTTQTAIEAMKLGAYDYLLKPFDVSRLMDLVHSALKSAREMKEVVSVQPLLESEDYESGVIGRSRPMQEVFKLVGQVASSDATALITGETGTGKELVARAIYHHSQRSRQPFLAINCAALPENLLESELFGHEKGAFTGATSQRIGKFEQCDGGTLFLDEIGDMALSTQTKILRVLQSGTFERVGGSQTVQVSVRLIAATNKPLEELVSQRDFREDLFYRLNVMRIRLPPLRERRDDIPLLIHYFLNRMAQKQGRSPKSISHDAVSLLQSLPWHGNVRELENVIQRAMIVAKGDAILLSDLPHETLASAAPPQGGQTPPASTGSGSGGDAQPHAAEPERPAMTAGAPVDLDALATELFRWAREHQGTQILPEIERQLVIRALQETGGNQVQAARILGITRATLRKRIEKFQIKPHIRIE